jgi:4-hydroxy-2-oxoheptanedioate aldolase
VSAAPTSPGRGEAGWLRRTIAARGVTHGGWCMMANSFAAEIVAASGCDWLCLDMQHGYISDEAMRSMIVAASIHHVPVVVRVPGNEPNAIMHALDAGAEGVIVPMISSADDARRAVESSHYPPLGARSWGPLRAALAQPGFDPVAGNEQVVCIGMMETVEGVEKLDEIIAVPGLDAVLVGPNDLAISHAGTRAGAATSSRDLELIGRVGSVCAEAGFAAGIVSASGKDARRWEAAGFTLLALPSDVMLLGAGMRQHLEAARNAAP